MAGYINSGAKSAGWYRQKGIDLSTSGIVAAATAGVANVVAQPVTVPVNVDVLYIQTITIIINTAAAQTITFQDTAGTPVVLWNIPASQAVGPYRVDFGAKGFALTAGKNLSIVGTAGPAYAYSIEAYADGPAVTQATTVDRVI